MLTELCRFGADGDLRYTQQGTPILTIRAAYDIGFGDKKRTQWISIKAWGKKGEGLAPYVQKGGQAFITAESPEVRTWDKDDGSTGVALEARLVDLKFAGKGEARESAPAPQPKPESQQGGFGDFDDDIPF